MLNFIVDDVEPETICYINKDIATVLNGVIDIISENTKVVFLGLIAEDEMGRLGLTDKNVNYYKFFVESKKRFIIADDSLLYKFSTVSS